MKQHDLQGTVRSLESGALLASATAVTAETTIGRAAYKYAVVGAWFVPGAAMTGAATNNRYISVVNKGSAGTGSTALATITYTGSINGTALVPQAMTLGADVAVAAGDWIAVQQLVNGTGLPLAANSTVQVDLAGA